MKPVTSLLLIAFVTAATLGADLLLFAAPRAKSGARQSASMPAPEGDGERAPREAGAREVSPRAPLAASSSAAWGEELLPPPPRVITLPTMLIAAPAPPARKEAAPAWTGLEPLRCGAWRALAAGPVTQQVRYCEPASRSDPLTTR